MNNTAPDFNKENQYEYRCGFCGVTAYGRKGRCECDDCDAAGEAIWNRAVDCAARQFETYVAQGKTETPEQRRTAMQDAMQHGVGLIRLDEYRRKIALLGDPRQRVTVPTE